MLADICSGSCDSNPVLLGSAGHTVLWLATEEYGGKPRLWRSDGTRPGTYRLAGELVEARGSAYQYRLQAAGGGAVYFLGCTEAQGCELWRSDGSREGTRLVADLTPGAASSDLGEFTFAGGRLFFSGSGRSLWVSDGTAAGTIQLGTFKSLHHLTASGHRLYFFGGTGDDQELWVSDGTAAGTRRSASSTRLFPSAPAASSPRRRGTGSTSWLRRTARGRRSGAVTVPPRARSGSPTSWIPTRSPACRWETSWRRPATAAWSFCCRRTAGPIP